MIITIKKSFHNLMWTKCVSTHARAHTHTHIYINLMRKLFTRFESIETDISTKKASIY